MTTKTRRPDVLLAQVAVQCMAVLLMYGLSPLLALVYVALMAGVLLAAANEGERG